MSRETSIEWADSTCNPTMGCDGCELWQKKPGGKKTCYAGILHLRYSGQKGYAPGFENVTKFPGRTEEAAKWPDLRGEKRKTKPWLNDLPRIIFLGDMSDMLSKAVDFPYLKQQVFDVAMSRPGNRHIYLFLTKRSERLVELDKFLNDQGIKWPVNIWPMVSITSEKVLGRAVNLCKVGPPGTVRGLSIEPILSSFALRSILSEIKGNIHWGAIGGESGQKAVPCNINDIRCLIDELRMLGISPFVKQLGSYPMDYDEPIKLTDEKGGNWSEWPEDIRVREYPQFTKTIPFEPAETAQLAL